MSAGAVSDAWSWRHAICKSNLPATTKHVLLTLSIYMDEAGRSCFPKVSDVVAATGLSNRAVVDHIAKACDSGFLKRRLHGFRGQRWRRMEYEAVWPGREMAPDEGGELDASPSECGERGAPVDEVNDDHQGGEPGAPKVVNDVHQDKDQSTDQSKTSPKEKTPRERGIVDQGDKGRASQSPDRAAIARWRRLKKDYPGAALDDLEMAERRFFASDEADQVAMLEAVPRLVEYLKGQRRRTLLQVYIGQRVWEILPEAEAETDGPEPDKPAAATTATVALAPAFDRAWRWLYHDFLARHGVEAGRRDSRAHREINKHASLAERGVGWRLDDRAALERAEEAGKALVKVPVDSDTAQAWSGHYYSLGPLDLPTFKRGVRMPMPDLVGWIFVPDGEPGAHAGEGG